MKLKSFIILVTSLVCYKVAKSYKLPESSSSPHLAFNSSVYSSFNKPHALLKRQSVEQKPYLGPILKTCSTMSYRREIRDLSSSELSLYLAAVMQIYKTGKLDEFVKLHSKEDGVGYFAEVHKVPYFLPWHRAFTKYYEMTLSQYLPPGFGLPYWDWTKDSNDPKGSVLFTKKYMGSINEKGHIIDGLFNKKDYQVNLPSLHALKRNYYNDENKSFWSMKRVKDVLKQSTFSEMAKALEAGPHDIFHSWIGGEGGDLRLWMSPNDPIFFLHHSFVDYLFLEWEDKHPGYVFEGKAFGEKVKGTNKVPHFGTSVNSLKLKDMCVEYIPSGQKLNRTLEIPRSSETTATDVQVVPQETQTHTTESTKTSTPTPSSNAVRVSSVVCFVLLGSIGLLVI